jgi:hypothetical protein
MSRKHINNGDAWVKKRLQGKTVNSKPVVKTSIPDVKNYTVPKGTIEKGSRQNINVGETGLVVRTKINENFIETYKSNLGIQRIKIEWNSVSSLIFRAGYLEIAETIYEISSQFIKTGITGLTASTWYYIYVNPPTSSIEITTTQIEIEDTEPVLNDSLMAYYHPTETTWRCIGVIYSDGGSNIRAFHLENNQYFYETEFVDYDTTSLPDIATVVNFTMPPITRYVMATVILRDTNTDDNVSAYYNNTGTLAIQKVAAYVYLDTNTSFSNQIFVTNTSQQGYFRKSIVTGNNANFTVRTTGFILPSEFYN